jgi:3'(2'), 5'-bisphosphate nucleotidase
MTTDPNQLLLDVTALAREAGRAILEVYASSFSVQEKADSSPLTEADLRSEKLILAGLRRIAPEIPVLSEESAQAAFATRRKWSRLWVVDPLDGTKEFVQRNGEFTVNIALVDNQRPVLGIVHAPVL